MLVLHRYTSPNHKRRCLLGTVLFAWMFSLPPAQANGSNPNCSDTEQALEYWRPVKTGATTRQEPVDELAISLLPCLGSRDGELRDRIGYELLTYWLRGDKLTDETRRSMLVHLMDMAAAVPDAEPSDAVFARSFSALVLSEVMRSDAQRAFMTTEEREKLLAIALDALARENDFRGLDAELGWVHPVAHQSDLLWRFTLHPETHGSQAARILDVVSAKATVNVTFYHFNEGDRLARSVAVIVQRELVSTDAINEWLLGFATPETMPAWSDAYKSRQGMAELHNTKQFIRSLASQLDSESLDETIAARLDELLRQFTDLV